MIIDHIEERKKEVSGSTIHQTVTAMKHFFEMNDAEEAISWSKIARSAPLLDVMIGVESIDKKHIFQKQT